MAVTPNYGWTVPTVGADSDTWGGINNAAFDAADASLKTVDDKTALAAQKANNGSDFASAAAVRTNLELGTAAVAAATRGSLPVSAVLNYTGGNIAQYVSSGGADGTIGDSGISASSVMVTTANLSGLANTGTARSNLGLGSIATHNVTISSSPPSGGSDGDIWLQYVP